MTNSKSKNQIVTREQWLQDAVVLMEPWFQSRGYKIPRVRVSCGWPSARGLAKKNPTIGQCWDKSAATDKVAQIFISPRLKEDLGVDGVLSTLAHELVHAVIGCEEGHNKVFNKCRKAVGLTAGNPKNCGAGEEMLAEIKVWNAKLGDYPHAVLNPKGNPVKKQTTRLIKCECGKCGYNVRVTRKWLDEIGAPLCPCNKEPMDFEI